MERGEQNCLLEVKGCTLERDGIGHNINKKKHHVSFEEAKTVFWDGNALLIDDPEHSVNEERFIMLGFSEKLRMLVVCHCYRSEEERIRIISARKATKHEAYQYHQANGGN